MDLFVKADQVTQQVTQKVMKLAHLPSIKSLLWQKKDIF